MEFFLINKINKNRNQLIKFQVQTMEKMHSEQQ